MPCPPSTCSHVLHPLFVLLLSLSPELIMHETPFETVIHVPQRVLNKTRILNSSPPLNYPLLQCYRGMTLEVKASSPIVMVDIAFANSHLSLSLSACPLTCGLVPQNIRLFFSRCGNSRVTIDMINIRTITSGLSLSLHDDEGVIKEKIKQAANFNSMGKQQFELRGYVVQTTRVVVNSFTEWCDLSSLESSLERMKTIIDACKEAGVHFFNIGPAIGNRAISFVPDILGLSNILNASAIVSVDNRDLPDESVCLEICKAIKRLADESENGLGSFRFCASAAIHLGPNIPFFPAGHHSGGGSVFSIGLESSKIAVESFEGALTFEGAEESLRRHFNNYLAPIETIAKSFATAEFSYGGIDSSINPSLDPAHSIAKAFESLPWVKTFGKSGTLATASMCTKVLKSLEIKTCGYSGLMLPPLEDHGLAARATEGAYSLHELLLFSAVCGIGIDCVPIPGDFDIEVVRSILYDFAALANRLKKPLSCRLFPAPNLKGGDITTFDSPYLCNCKVFDV